MYIKDFDSWNLKKQGIEKRVKKLYVKEREVWWCMLGVNVGQEIDGKHQIFERPVLIIKVISRETFFVLPLTTKGKEDRDHRMIKTKKMVSFVKLSQARVVSSKRLSRKVDTVPDELFKEIKKAFIEYIE